MSDQLSADLASLRIQRDAPPPPARSYAKVIALLVFILAIAAGVYFLKPTIESQIFKTEVSVAEIISVSPVQAAVDVTSTGYVIPQIVAKVGPKIVGRVTKVAVREGETVKSGQVLFELDAADQKSAVAAAQAKVAAAHARAQASRANVAEIEIQWQRQKKLAESGAAPAATSDDLEARTKALREAVKASDAEALAAQADVTALAIGLKNLTVASPIDGTALTKPAEVGEIVGPQSVLIELADFKSLLIESDVPEARLHLIKQGGPCEVVLDSIPDARFRGTVVDISPRFNRSKATATVKVKLVDVPERLRPEMSARVNFLSKPLEAGDMKAPEKVIVPSGAVVDRAGSKAIFVVDGGRVRLVTVSLGAATGGGFELKDGPRPGTRVVKDPPSTLTDGQAIKEKTS